MGTVPPKLPMDQRPRLSVVVPLLGVCFLASYLMLRQAWQERQAPGDWPPMPRYTNYLRAPVRGGADKSRPEGMWANRPSSPERDRVPPTPLPDRFQAPPLPTEIVVIEEVPPSPGWDALAREKPGGRPVIESPPPPIPVAYFGLGETGTVIYGKVSLKGQPPPEEPLKLSPVAINFRPNALFTRHFVVDEQGGLANVLVYIKDGLSNRHFYPPPVPVELEIRACEFMPTVFGFQTNQLLHLRNADHPFAHLITFSPTLERKTAPQAARVVLKQVLERRLAGVEGWLTVKCELNPQMPATGRLIDNPFFTVTATNGLFVLTNVPPGKYTLEAVHLKAGAATQVVTVTIGAVQLADFVLAAPTNLSQVAVGRP